MNRIFLQKAFEISKARLIAQFLAGIVDLPVANHVPRPGADGDQIQQNQTINQQILSHG